MSLLSSYYSSTNHHAMQIPFHKPFITEDEIAEVVDSLRSGWITMGPKTGKFEEEFSEYIGAKHAVAVNSCTAALHLALKVINLKAGDEVIVPTVTFTATAEVVCYFGAKPVIVDVEKGTQNIDSAAVERAITGRTKAIIPVHFGGQPCDMDEILSLAERHKLYVIEDAAHAVPAWYGTRSGRVGRKIGTIGDMTCFSFYATKTLATGEGGMVTTENEEWAEKMRIMRLHGISKDAWKRYTGEGSWHYEVVDAGYKYNMTDIQAGLGRAQLRKVERMWERRKTIAQKYSEAFSSLEEIETPIVKEDRETSWHLYVIQLKREALTTERSRFMDELRERGITTSVHFIPLHRHPFYRDTFGLTREDFPVAERYYERCVSLPLYVGMTDAESDYVIDTVIDTVKRSRR